jgi:hypothetical protein
MNTQGVSNHIQEFLRDDAARRRRTNDTSKIAAPHGSRERRLKVTQ